MPVDVAVEAASATALLSGTSYVNLHTTANAAGEIRGDVVADPNGTNQCASAADAGVDSGTGGSTADAGSGTGTNDAGSSGSSGGATTTRPDSGTSSTATSSGDDGGCSAAPAGTNAGNGLAIVGLGLAIAAVARSKRAKKR
jgi:hypothetical protein